MMMGITVDNLFFIYRDNQQMLRYNLVPESTLKKKIYNVAYHYMKDCVSFDEWWKIYI